MLLRVMLGERGFQRAFEGSGDEAVLGFARVVLSARPFGLVGGALDGEPLQSDPVVVFGLQRLDGVCAGLDAGWGDGIQKRLRERAIDAERADRLAGSARAVLLEGARAQVASGAAVAAGVGDHHSPSAASAAQETLQQR